MKHSMGISGPGWIADFYYQQYLGLKNRFNLVGCSGNTTEEGKKRLSHKCSKWKVRAYKSFSEMLKDRDLTCVAIMSPTSLHYEQASSALKAGKHVLVEKPVALNSQEFKNLGNLAESCKKVIFPGHNFVYRPVVQKAKEIIDSGALGIISYASFRAAHFIPEEHASGWRKNFDFSGGGAMMDSGTHLVYQLIFLLGLPKWISCFMANKHYKSMESEDTCNISLEFEDGRISNVFQSWSCQDNSFGEIRIQGTNGVLLLTDKLFFNGDVLEEDSSYEKSFFHTLNAFADAMEDIAKPLSDIKAAEQTYKIITAAYKTAEGKSVTKLQF